MPKSKKSDRRPTAENVVEALDGMESELRQLAGLVTALRYLGEADDAIEPVAISSLARSAESALDDIQQLWWIAISTLRSP